MNGRANVSGYCNRGEHPKAPTKKSAVAPSDVIFCYDGCKCWCHASKEMHPVLLAIATILKIEEVNAI